LRINLNCAESRIKYYGNDPAAQTKLGNLIEAASTPSGFDEYPPEIPSKAHPCFNKSTVEGQRASKLYGALEALRKSVYKRGWEKKRKINNSSTSNQHLLTLAAATTNTSPLESLFPTTADKVTSSPSSSSNQPTSVLGKRTSSSMESSPIGTTNISPLEPLNPTTVDEITSSSSSSINQPSSIMGKLSSSVASVFNSLSVIIGGRTAEENEDEKEKTGMNLREELDNTENADDESVEFPRGSTKIGEDVCCLTLISCLFSIN
jgi:hypothetical protein